MQLCHQKNEYKYPFFLTMYNSIILEIIWGSSIEEWLLNVIGEVFLAGFIGDIDFFTV